MRCKHASQLQVMSQLCVRISITYYLNRTFSRLAGIYQLANCQNAKSVDMAKCTNIYLHSDLQGGALQDYHP